MNRWLAFAALRLISCSLVHARAQAQTPRTEDQLLQLVRDWLDAEARGDHAVLDTLAL